MVRYPDTLRAMRVLIWCLVVLAKSLGTCIFAMRAAWSLSMQMIRSDNVAALALNVIGLFSDI